MSDTASEQSEATSAPTAEEMAATLKIFGIVLGALITAMATMNALRACGDLDENQEDVLLGVQANMNDAIQTAVRAGVINAPDVEAAHEKMFAEVSGLL